MALPMKKSTAMKAAAMKKSAGGMKKSGAMKAMKAMKRVMKAKKVSKVAKGKLARSIVFRGGKEKTVGGMTKDKLTKNKLGKVVSKKASARAKRAYAGSAIKKWAEATKAARKALGLTGFVPVGGRTAAGKALYAKAKTLLAA